MAIQFYVKDATHGSILSATIVLPERCQTSITVQIVYPGQSKRRTR